MILPPPSSQSSQSSQFRLSLSLEGKAEVVPSTTSPPHLGPSRPSSDRLGRLPPLRRPALYRSQSTSSSPISAGAATSPGAVGGGGLILPPISALTGALPPRLTRGRSRDVHAWEFCCDAPENREDELLAHAKHEGNGSAIAAISLLRSTSSPAAAVNVGGGGSKTATSTLQPSTSTKRNAAHPTGITKKPKLGRVSSSVARTQTTGGSSSGLGPGLGGMRDKQRLAAAAMAAVAHEKSGKGPRTLSASGHDSDKENWSPDEDGRHERRPSHQEPWSRARTSLPSTRKPLPTAGAAGSSRRTMGGHVLGGCRLRGPTFVGGEEGSRDAQAAAALEIFDDGDDQEMERFMRGDVSPSKKGDVDAVAGLLSLSQGNWR